MDYFGDKILIKSAIYYLAIPIIIFLLGWINIFYSIPCVAVFIYILKIFLSEISYKKIKIEKKNLLLFIIIISLIWVYISGIGGFGYQNTDFAWRNAMFRDLIEYEWPVKYPTENETFSTMIYYIGFWLPSALVGKITNFELANKFLYIWSSIGVMLTFGLLIRWLNKKSYLAILVFIFFSGNDIIGYLFNNKFNLGNHIEWWAHYFQYSSTTTLLFWVFNQAIPAWIITLLILNIGTNKNVVFIFSLGMIFCPLPLLGLTPIVLFVILNGECNNNLFNIPNKLIFIKNNISDSIKIENIIIPLLFTIIFGIYYTSNISGSSSENGIIFNVFNTEKKIIAKKMIIFIFLEIGIYYLFLIRDILKNSLLFLVSILLIFIPLYRFGSGNEFAMRASVPGITLFICYFIKFLTNKNSKFKKMFLILIFCIGAITPISEMSRFFLYGTYIDDKIKSLANRKKGEDALFILHDAQGKKLLNNIYK